MSRPLKIVVAGYAVGFPMGGQIWVMLHYLLGLTRMGHDVLFLEDTSDWSYPFDPVRGYNETDSSFGRGVLDKMLAHFGLKGRWAYNSVFEDRLYGISQEELDRFCSEADLLLNISGVNPLRENYMRCRVKAVIDTDPVFTQVKIERDPATSAYYKAHDACFTFVRAKPRFPCPALTGSPLFHRYCWRNGCPWPHRAEAIPPSAPGTPRGEM
jgi:hypothetical protein